MLTSQLGDVVRWECRRVCKRFIERVHERGNRLGKIRRKVSFAQSQDGMLRAAVLGNPLRVRRLVRFLAIEANRERLQRPVARLVGEGDDRARVQAPTQKDSERHLAHQSNPHGFLEQLGQLLDDERFIFRRLFASEVERPVRTDMDCAVLVDQLVSRGQLSNATEHRLFPGDESQREVGDECSWVRLRKS